MDDGLAAQRIPGAKVSTDSALADHLRRAIRGDVLFSSPDRGRYATDASHYQVMPRGIVVPRTREDALAAIAIARDAGVPVTARGGGTSQCGQTINSGLVIDTSKHLNRILALDVERRRCIVEPGIVLDDLNRHLKPHGLWFPVDVSTASRATLGGMAGNNSCGGRSLRYGTMRDNTLALTAALADGTVRRFGPVAGGGDRLADTLMALGRREADEIAVRFPKVQRRVGGYNLDALIPDAGNSVNLAHLFVGSEGTLGFTTELELKLWPIIAQRAVGVCHFGSFYEAMDAAQHLVKLQPIAVELVDKTMIALGRDIAMFRPTIEKIVRGTPEALLVVEFAEADAAANAACLAGLADVMADLGFGWSNPPKRWGGVVPVTEAALQSAIAEFRTAGLNVMMSMKQAGKPVSFIEDCAVPLEHLADYTAQLTDLFARHGTHGTWYAHASEGCLHVRPVLNLKLEKDARAMRAIAEEAFALVRRYKGSHSGEHGDGLVRSEFHRVMFGDRLADAFKEVKSTLDPAGCFNPGRIVDAPRMDDRSLFRYAPAYGESSAQPVLDWSEYPGGARGFQGAAEMCNNNGACRSRAGGVMCPSYRITGDERDVTRGRANTLRLALSGQLGHDALASDAMADAMSLCVSCKACRRECPTGVDMARMKIEVLAARAAKTGVSLRDRLIAELPRYAPFAARVPLLANLRDTVPGLAALSERWLGLAADRTLPRFRRDVFRTTGTDIASADVVLFADTFNRYHDRENLDAALVVLKAAGLKVHVAQPTSGRRPLCCGRTYLATGLVAQARAEAQRTLDALGPAIERRLPVLGLEPSCLLTFRDEFTALGLGEPARRLKDQAQLIEEYLAAKADAGTLRLDLAPIAERALLHGHCHQKAFGALGATEHCLRLIPGLAVETVQSSCCGMAGAFGYQAETRAQSQAMAELALLPAVRKAAATTRIVADGTSCRHQIGDGTGRSAVHVVRLLAESATRERERRSV